MDIVSPESNPEKAGHAHEPEVTVPVIVNDTISETINGVNVETGNNVIVEPVNSTASIPATITDITVDSVIGMGDIVQVMDDVTGAAVHTIQDVSGKFETIVTGSEAGSGSCVIQNVTVEAVNPGDSPVIKTEAEECVNMVQNVIVEDGCIRSTPVPIECAVEDVDNMKVHQVAIKILNTEQELAGTDEPCLEPSAKRFCVETADGQTYMVAMPSHIDGEAVAAMQGTTLAELQGLQEPKQNVDVTQAWFTSRDDKTALSSKGMQRMKFLPSQMCVLNLEREILSV